MSDKTILSIQRALSQLGFAPGPLDGLEGKRTKAALDAARLAGEEPGDALKALEKSIKGEALYLPTLREMQAFESAFPAEWLKPLHRSLSYAHIIPSRLPMYLAQLAHESAGFKTLEEYASGEAYEGRPDLGNTQPGDGKRYKGRGVIQLTGRANYARYGALLHLRLEDKPERAARPEEAFKVAALYWLDRNINAPADLDDLETVTRRINGGLNGLKDRKFRLDKARALFRPGDVAASTPAPVADDEDDAPTVIARNPTLIPDVEHPPGALKRERVLSPDPRKRTQEIQAVIDEINKGKPTPGIRVPVTKRALKGVSVSDTPLRRTPSPPRPVVSQPAPSPADPTPEVIPMSSREESRKERKEKRKALRERRQLVRKEFIQNSTIWISRYREALADIVAEAVRDGFDQYMPDKDDREEAELEALDSFIEVLVGTLARAATSSREGRVRIIHNERLRAALLTAVKGVFCRLLRNAIQNVEIAREAASAGLLTDKSAEAGPSIMGVFSDLLSDEPEVINPPHRDPIVSDRKPGIIGGIPVMEAPTRAPVSASEVIEIPGE